MRYRLSNLQIVACLAGCFTIFYYLTPYSQYGRRFSGAPFQQQVSISLDLLETPNDTRQKFEESDTGGGLSAYYNSPQGFWDRLQFVSVDDKLVNITDKGKVFGLQPIVAYLFNAVPHFIWPDKPDINYGNLYAHELGGMAESDVSTGISFSPTAEAFHLAKWVGIFVVAPLLWFLLFVVFDSIFGDIRATPWGLLALAYISHSAPETGLGGVIGALSFGTEILVFCAFFATKVAPIIANVVLGPDRRMQRTDLFRPAFTPRGHGPRRWQ
jgi:hypothetical protein